jgi:hypothetical protein
MEANGNESKFAAKRSKQERLRDLEVISEWYLRGWNQMRITEELEKLRGYKISRSQVAHDIVKIQQQWMQNSIHNVHAAKMKECAKLDVLEREYWAAWEKSKGKRKVITQKKVVDVVTETTLRVEDMAGNPSYLAGVLTCVERRCALLGLDKPIKVEHSGSIDTNPPRTLKEAVEELNTVLAKCGIVLPIDSQKN